MQAAALYSLLELEPTQLTLVRFKSLYNSKFKFQKKKELNLKMPLLRRNKKFFSLKFLACAKIHGVSFVLIMQVLKRRH